MRDIAKLLLAGADGGLPDLFGGEGGDDAAERVRRANDWCGSTPGQGSLADAVGDAALPRARRPEARPRKLRPW